LCAINYIYTLVIKVKEIEKRDSVLTSKQQIDRLLRPGASYFNLNPYEVLQLEHDTPLDEARKKYKRVSSTINIIIKFYIGTHLCY